MAIGEVFEPIALCGSTSATPATVSGAEAGAAEEFLVAARGTGDGTTSGVTATGEVSEAALATGAGVEGRFSPDAAKEIASTPFLAASAGWMPRPIDIETARNASTQRMDIPLSTTRGPSSRFFGDPSTAILRRLTKPSRRNNRFQISTRNSDYHKLDAASESCGESERNQNPLGPKELPSSPNRSVRGILGAPA